MNGGAAGQSGGFGGFGGGYTSYQDMDINDIFSHFSDIFGDMGGRSRSVDVLPQQQVSEVATCAYV